MEKTIIFWEKKKNNLICEKLRKQIFWKRRTENAVIIPKSYKKYFCSESMVQEKG